STAVPTPVGGTPLHGDSPPAGRADPTATRFDHVRDAILRHRRAGVNPPPALRFAQRGPRSFASRGLATGPLQTEGHASATLGQMRGTRGQHGRPVRVPADGFRDSQVPESRGGSTNPARTLTPPTHP